MIERITSVVIGGGPAGLMAAEQIVKAGHRCVVIEAMPTVGRKLLMAGKSGLNLTKDESIDAFLAAYGESAEFLAPFVKYFGAQEVCDWAKSLGVEVFTGSSRRVFPIAMKASPLLRAWRQRLSSLGCEFRTSWTWIGFSESGLRFNTPDGPREIASSATILALGGASWKRLGSNGEWASLLAAEGVELRSFKPSNMGFYVDWSAHLEPAFGRPIKPLALRAGIKGSWLRGEVIVSKRGVEGGGLYPVSAAIRDGDELYFDLLPDLTKEEIAERLSQPPSKQTLTEKFRKRLRLDPVRLAVAQEFGRPWPSEPRLIAEKLKALKILLGDPFPMDEAISTSGGIAVEALTDELELKAKTGVFVAGEMIDWDAPTGGYLLTACFSTGYAAGNAVVKRLGQASA